MLAYLVAILILSVIWFLLIGALTNLGDDPTAGLFAGLVSMALFGVVAFIGSFIVQAAVTRAALAITYGQRIELQALFALDGVGQLILGAVLLGVASSVGYLLCFVPGLVVVFFGQFFVHFLLDKRLSAVDAIRASFGFVNKNLGTLIGFYLASLLAYMVGALLCGIGLLVAFPVVVIAQAYTYRRLQGEPVAA